jgi:hypothetical protein
MHMKLMNRISLLAWVFGLMAGGLAASVVIATPGSRDGVGQAVLVETSGVEVPLVPSWSSAIPGAAASAPIAVADHVAAQTSLARDVHIRAGRDRTIVRVTPNPAAAERLADELRGGFPHPRPPLAGFSPLVAIATSDRRVGEEFMWEHVAESTYVGSPLNPPAGTHFVVGIFDSGSDVDLAAGSAAVTLGLTGQYLTQNTIPIGGVGGDEILATITQPIGYFAAGLDAIDASGRLDTSAMVGHSNVAALVSPPLDCGTGESITAIVGRPLIAIHNTIIRVDTPRSATVGGQTFTSPDVQIQDPFEDLPNYARLVAIEFGGLSPATTASYYGDFEDFMTPMTPTLMSLSGLSIPTGGAFFTDFTVQHNGFGASVRAMVDTGAQSTIISPATAARLSLPIEPDFTVDVCGVGGLEPDVPGYYIDLVTIPALGGAMEFSRVPVVVLNLASPEGGGLDAILGMIFFWNRNVILEPSFTASGFLHVSDPVAFAYGDFDWDRDVDLNDMETFASCVTGPEEPGIPGCDQVDADGDFDVDLADFRTFQKCFSGEGIVADTACGAPE